MIYLYTGKTGRGKTYKIVADIYNQKLYEKHVIYHNIDGLKPDEFGPNAVFVDWRVYCQNRKITPSQFFTIAENQIIFENARNEFNRTLMIVVDECHQWFGSKDDLMLTWVAYTRHLATFLCLITQSEMMIHHTYRKLVDLTVRANVKFLGFFVYNKFEGQVGCGFQFAKIRKKIFSLYKSAEIITTGYRTYIYAVIACCVLVFGFFMFRNVFREKSEKLKTEKNTASQNISPSKTSVSNSVVPAVKSRSYLIDSELDFVAKSIYYLSGKIDFKRSRFYVRDIATGYVADLSLVRPDYFLIRWTDGILFVQDRATRECHLIVRRVTPDESDKDKNEALKS